MKSVQCFGANGAPPPLETLQSRRVTSRFAVSAAVAGVLAELAYGAPRHDQGALLTSLVASRVEAAHVG